MDILIAPLSGSEGIALHDYAKTQPQVTFINGCSAALETTYVNPAPNFFRFNLDGAQIHKGLGEYIYNVKHYHKIATLAEDYSFTYTQVFGLALDYCPLGGQITKRMWVPLGTKDFASVSRSYRMMSMQSISALAALTPSTSSISTSRPAATPSS